MGNHLELHCKVGAFSFTSSPFCLYTDDRRDGPDQPYKTPQVSLNTATSRPIPFSDSVADMQTWASRSRGDHDPGAISAEAAIRQMGEDEQEEWEYEYSTTETEVRCAQFPPHVVI